MSGKYSWDSRMFYHKDEGDDALPPSITFSEFLSKSEPSSNSSLELDSESQSKLETILSVGSCSDLRLDESYEISSPASELLPKFFFFSFSFLFFFFFLRIFLKKILNSGTFSFENIDQLHKSSQESLNRLPYSNNTHDKLDQLLKSFLFFLFYLIYFFFMFLF